MNKKILFFLFLTSPFLVGSTLTVKEGLKEVGTIETHDGSSEEETISDRELKKEAGGYTKLDADELEEHKKNSPNADTIPVETLAAPKPFAQNYGVLEGITEQEVEAIASRENMGVPNKTTEYSAGDTYPVRTWAYEYEAGGLKHWFKVHFDTDGKVKRASHQTANS